ncbi:hypothetical protein [Pseudaminobacter soli (ex Li et al. 2025)]|uniref:Uncharacterized protein n=1 Tax=Pseudaminobacter soli (ex Li et al. 2025) TaxID=1295366 RepID=A0A2P7SAJ6_9HYPH|nr:hypothetical protein [Mesorhizobium soli]PSJ59345.1 hypothetical protein C7I85_17215 [Mesorhizobium soli]
MEHIAALLLIIGCSGDLKQCSELPAPVTVYETSEECNTALPFALNDAQGERVRVFGTCVFVDPAMEEDDAELNWDITSDGKLVASVDFPDPVVTAATPPPQQASLQAK